MFDRRFPMAFPHVVSSAHTHRLRGLLKRGSLILAADLPAKPSVTESFEARLLGGAVGSRPPPFPPGAPGARPLPARVPDAAAPALDDHALPAVARRRHPGRRARRARPSRASPARSPRPRRGRRGTWTDRSTGTATSRRGRRLEPPLADRGRCARGPAPPGRRGGRGAPDLRRAARPDRAPGRRAPGIPAFVPGRGWRRSDRLPRRLLRRPRAGPPRALAPAPASARAARDAGGGRRRVGRRAGTRPRSSIRPAASGRRRPCRSRTRASRPPRRPSPNGGTCARGDRLAIGLSPAQIFGFVRGVAERAVARRGGRLLSAPAGSAGRGRAARRGRGPSAERAAASLRAPRLARPPPRSALRRGDRGGGRCGRDRVGPRRARAGGLRPDRDVRPRQPAAGRPAPPARLERSGRARDGRRDRPRRWASLRQRASSARSACAAPAVFGGYLAADDPDPFDAEGRLRSGDAGFLDEAGELCVRGRLAFALRSGDRILCAEEVEAAIAEHPGVAEAAAAPCDRSFGVLVVVRDASEAIARGDPGARAPAAAGRSRGRGGCCRSRRFPAPRRERSTGGRRRNG